MVFPNIVRLKRERGATSNPFGNAKLGASLKVKGYGAAAHVVLQQVPPIKNEQEGQEQKELEQEGDGGQEEHGYQLYLNIHPLESAPDNVVPGQNISFIPDVSGPGIEWEIGEGSVVYILAVRFEKKEGQVPEPENQDERPSSPNVQSAKNDSEHDELESQEIKGLVLRRRGPDVYKRIGMIGGGDWKARRSKKWTQVMLEQTITII